MLRRLLRKYYHRFIKPELVRRRLTTARSVLHIEFHGDGIGFFAQLSACLHIFRHAEARGLVPFVKLSSPNYLDSGMGDDWLQYHFDHPAAGGEFACGNRRILRIGDIGEMPDFGSDLSLADANTLFFRHLQIKPGISAAVDRFCKAHLIGSGTLGVHYRGTDKDQEAARLGYDAAFASIGAVLVQRPGVTNLFVASDEQDFMDRIAGRFPHLPAVAFDDSVRSRDGRPVHLGQRAPGNFMMGRDALMNSLLLSRCGAVVRTTSFLSAWSSIFNPALPVFLLNVPYSGKLWFPEREIIKSATLMDGRADAAWPGALLLKHH